MRIRSAVIATLAVVAFLGSGCQGGDDRTNTYPSPQASRSPMGAGPTPGASNPASVPAEPSPSPVPTAPLPDAEVLEGEAPDEMPVVRSTPHDEFARDYLLILKEVAPGYASIKWAEVAKGNSVQCDDDVLTEGAYGWGAKWCSNQEALLVLPTEFEGIISERSGDEWSVLRVLTSTFAVAQLDVAGTLPAAPADQNWMVRCAEGVLIWKLTEHGYLSFHDAHTFVLSYGNSQGRPSSTSEYLWKGFATGDCA